MTLQAEDIAFWAFALAALAVIMWMLIGSPTLEAGLITIGVFILSSEFMLWKNYFKVEKNTTLSISKLDKNTAVSFTKLKNDITNLKNGQIEINNRLGNIETLIKK